MLTSYGGGGSYADVLTSFPYPTGAAGTGDADTMGTAPVLAFLVWLMGVAAPPPPTTPLLWYVADGTVAGARATDLAVSFV